MASDTEHEPADRPPEPADRWLRGRTEPPPPVARRIARASLAGNAGRRPRSPRPVAAAVAVIAVLAALGYFLAAREWEKQGPPRRLAAVERETPTVPTITDRSGQLELILPSSSPPRVAETVSKTPVIFNESRVAVAVVPGGMPMFVITGGES